MRLGFNKTNEFKASSSALWLTWTNLHIEMINLNPFVSLLMREFVGLLSGLFSVCVMPQVLGGLYESLHTSPSLCLYPCAICLYNLFSALKSMKSSWPRHVLLDKYGLLNSNLFTACTCALSPLCVHARRVPLTSLCDWTSECFHAWIHQWKPLFFISTHTHTPTSGSLWTSHTIGMIITHGVLPCAFLLIKTLV